jgi:hypothetical protein
MEEEGLPLRRRVPGAERAGPGPWAPPKLSDSVLQRMQAAVNAAKAQSVDQAVEQDPDIAPPPGIAVEGPASGVSASSVNSTPAVNGTSPANGPSVGHAVQVKPERAAKPRRFGKRSDGPPAGKSEHDRGARLKNLARARGTAAAKPARKARPSTESEPTELPMRTVPTPARQFGLPAPPEAAASAPAIAPRNPSAGPRPTTLPQRSQSVPDTKPPQGLLPGASPRPAEPEPAPLPKRSVPTTSKPQADPATRPERTAADLSRARSTPTVPRSHAAPIRHTAQSQPPDVSSAQQAAVEALPRQRAQDVGRGHNKRFSKTWLVAAAVFLMVTASAVALALHGGPPTPNGRSLSPLQRQTAHYIALAAAWVEQEVSSGTAIACDKQTCSALAAGGFPAHYLRVLGPKSVQPFDAALIIETAAIRSLFGTSLNAQVAPAVLTTIGSGQAEITIRAIAPDGASTYQQKLAAGHEARQQNEEAVLQGTSPITTSPAAKKAIAGGDVDARLILAITDIADSLPVDVVGFGSDATKGSAYLPLRYADLAEYDTAAHMSRNRYLAAMRAALSRVPAPYRPLWVRVVPLPNGVRVLRIDVGAPSPPGFGP